MGKDKDEVNFAINNGADILMLPIRKVSEILIFKDIVEKEYQ